MYIIYDDLYLKHFTGLSHVENAGRLAAIIAAIKKSLLFKDLNFYRPNTADTNQVCLVHSPAYVEKIATLSEEAGKFDNNMLFNIDMDTVVSKYTYESAMLAAGAGISGIDLLFGEKEGDIFFALVRPPGHHAFKTSGSGFCIFNNIAIAAAYSIENHGLKRVAIIDFDVHHGNGTQDIFYEDDRVLYISLHQYPHYPGTGDWRENGSKKGEGFNLNIPLAANSNENDYLIAANEIILPVLERFNPELLLFSAGYDAHKDDSLSLINLKDDSYKKIMKLILSGCKQWPAGIDSSNRIAGKNSSNKVAGISGSGGKVAEKSSINMAAGNNNKSNSKGFKTGLILEGGYNYEATARGVLKTISACLEKGEDSFSGTGLPENTLSVKTAGAVCDDLNDCNLKNFNNIKKLFGI
jgi:acetoin utilization deacetylase AcuC-like enzyme